MIDFGYLILGKLIIELSSNKILLPVNDWIDSRIFGSWGMTTKVNGYATNGEFLTGNIDFFTIMTLVPCDNTLVTKPISVLKKELRILETEDISTVGGVTIFGVLYADDAEYNIAYDKQYNLNALVKLVETRAQPIMLNAQDLGFFANVSDSVTSLGGHAPDYGTTYSGQPGTVYSIKFAVEHESVWATQDILAEALDGLIILDTSDVIVGTKQYDTSTASLLNTVILKNEFI